MQMLKLQLLQRDFVYVWDNIAIYVAGTPLRRVPNLDRHTRV